VAYSRDALNNYVKVLLKEAELFRRRYDFTTDTVYLGGGTPSLLSAEQINMLLSTLEPAPGAEITLEVNPVQVTPDWVKALRTTRVNRLSLGVQSLYNENLMALGRKHTAESIPERLKLLREQGYDNISLDLMYGLPWFANYSIEAELQRYLELEPEHISTYLLTIEDNVPFRHWNRILPDDKTTEAQYYSICDIMEKAGFNHYELSNFAWPGKKSRHNLRYWQDENYIGLGAGASGFIKGQRYKKPEDLQLWEFSVEREDILYEKEAETRAQQKTDFIIMQFRLLRGLDTAAYQERFGTDFITDYHEVLDRYLASGHLEAVNGYIRLTRRAWFISNHILRDFA
jgi:oxygen-independent coproporphyrinogen-3 oxidase